MNSLLSTGAIVLVWWIWFDLIVSDNYVQLIGYNEVVVVKCEGSNLPLATGLSKWCPRLFRWCCLFMCIFKSMRYFHKCKIALIAIKQPSLNSLNTLLKRCTWWDGNIMSWKLVPNKYWRKVWFQLKAAEHRESPVMSNLQHSKSCPILFDN